MGKTIPGAYKQFLARVDVFLAILAKIRVPGESSSHWSQGNPGCKPDQWLHTEACGRRCLSGDESVRNIGRLSSFYGPVTLSRRSESACHIPL